MALDYLAVPDILVMCDASMIQVSASIMRFWEKMRLAPIGGKKRAYYTVITPTHLVDSKSSVSRQISDEVSLWFTEVACLFDLCGLGAMIDVNDGVSVNGHISVNVSSKILFYCISCKEAVFLKCFPSR